MRQSSFELYHQLHNSNSKLSFRFPVLLMSEFTDLTVITLQESVLKWQLYVNPGKPSCMPQCIPPLAEG